MIASKELLGMLAKLHRRSASRTKHGARRLGMLGQSRRESRGSPTTEYLTSFTNPLEVLLYPSMSLGTAMEGLAKTV